MPNKARLKDRIQVYVAGPITPQAIVGKHPVIEFLENVQRGVTWCLRIWTEGFRPYCAFFDFIYWLVKPSDIEITEKMIKDLSMTFVDTAHAVFVIPNQKGWPRWQDSTGAVAEIKRAEEIGVPVFYTIKALKEHFAKELK